MQRNYFQFSYEISKVLELLSRKFSKANFLSLIEYLNLLFFIALLLVILFLFSILFTILLFVKLFLYNFNELHLLNF